MEYFNLLQIILLLVIILALIGQLYVVQKGMLVPVNYTNKQKVLAGVVAAAPIVVWGAISNNYPLMIFGVVIGFACYKKNIWYKFKVKGS
ncbi:hypothetical protein [Paraglaciecola sp. 2405UD69-4]|uniref:hypothetical protein n=1 Tax=Paraglaciecola sp. 2405UD69-4 TaxID=3391836 RepID=UPI0039C9D450